MKLKIVGQRVKVGTKQARLDEQIVTDIVELQEAQDLSIIQQVWKFLNTKVW